VTAFWSNMNPNALAKTAMLSALLSAACSNAEKLADVGTDAGGEAAEAGSDAAMSGSGCADPNEAVDPTALIDDMEDQNSNLSAVGGRTGGWWTAGDGSGGATIVPPPGEGANPELVPGGRCGSTYAMRVTGQGFTDWGSLLGLSFAYGAGGAVAYDASRHEGITFWARVGDTSTHQLRLALSDVNSEPAGGVCSENGAVEQRCFDTFGVVISSLDTSWKRYRIPFLELTQRGFGFRADHVETSQLYTVGFNFDPGAIFDLWVDDISFY
jgi:endoglucanase